MKKSRTLLARILTVAALLATVVAGGGSAASASGFPVAAPAGAGTGAHNGPSPLPINTSQTGSSQFSMADPTMPGLSCADYGSNMIFTEPSNVWGNGSSVDEETACVDAMFAAQTEARMVAQWLGRNGLDGHGGAWPIKIGLPSNFPSADNYFSSNQVLIGHQPAVLGRTPDWLTSLTSVAHEFGHGIDSTTGAGLSGDSTREFIADAFGAATNSFANEPAPYHASNFVFGSRRMDTLVCYNGSTESREPHDAAEVGDYWFYLLAAGSNSTCNDTTVASTGIQTAIQVLYNAMLMKTSATSYAMYRTWTLTAAKNMFPHDCIVFNNVKAAWDAVSVPAQAGDPVCAPVTALLGPNQTGVEGTAVALGMQYNFAGGIAPYTYSAFGLPPGLSIVADSGTIWGTFAAAGTYQVIVRVFDSEPGSAPASTSFTWTVLPRPVVVPNIVGLSLSGGLTAIRNAGLIVGTERDVVQPACDFNINKIVGQTPSAGTVVSAGTAVNYSLGVKPSGRFVCQ